MAKYVSFERAGVASYGAISDDRIIDLDRRWRPELPTLIDAIAAGRLGVDLAMPCVDGLDPVISVVALLQPIPPPEKIICIGRNYRDHVVEAGLKGPTVPNLFLRLPNSVVPHGKELVPPPLLEPVRLRG